MAGGAAGGRGEGGEGGTASAGTGSRAAVTAVPASASLRLSSPTFCSSAAKRTATFSVPAALLCFSNFRTRT